MYILSSPARTVLVQPGWRKLLSMSGIQLHTGKTRCWNRMGQPPPTWRYCPEVWSPGGIKVLGNAVGLGGMRRPLRGSRKNAGCGRPSSGYLICSALGMSSCNVPVLGATTLCERCLLAVRLMLWTPCWAFPEQKDSTRSRRCWQLCQLGLRSAQRMAHAAYWTSWADALP